MIPVALRISRRSEKRKSAVSTRTSVSHRHSPRIEGARLDIKLCRSIIGIEIAMRDFAIGDAHGPDEDQASS